MNRNLSGEILQEAFNWERKLAFIAISVALALGVFILSLDYSYWAFVWWGKSFYVPIGAFTFISPHGSSNMGLLYVGDAVIWWGAFAFILYYTALNLKKFLKLARMSVTSSQRLLR